MQRPRQTLFSLGLIAALTVAGSLAQAKSIYVDPASGSDAGDGSSAAPYRSVQKVIDGGLYAAGDTILLSDGYHGSLYIKDKANAAHVVIAASGASARLSHVEVRDSSRWTLRKLDVSAYYAPSFVRDTMIELLSYAGKLADVVVEDCLVRTVADASSWSATDWSTKSCGGISAAGTKVTIRNNRFKNVRIGIALTASHSLVQGNTVENFAADGMRGLGDYTVFEGNTIKNCYDVDGNHDDGFQSWSKGADGTVGTGQVVGGVLRGNTFINFTDPKQPFRGTLQGIGMFDGTYVDWVIENNVVITDHWNGIVLLGAKNCRVVNNTLLDLNDVLPGPPKIRIAEHKDGTPPSGCVVRNNIAANFNSSATGVTEDHNLQISLADASKHFVDVASHDLRLIATSSAVDSGTPTLAPSVDHDGVSRPQGQGFDIGAFEYAAGSPPPAPDPGTDPEPDPGTDPEPEPEPDEGNQHRRGTFSYEGEPSTELIGGCAVGRGFGAPPLLSLLLLAGVWLLCRRGRSAAG